MGLAGQKRGPYKPRTRARPRTKLRKTVARYPLVAAYLRAGYSNADACRLAGFSKSTVTSSAKKIAQCEEVQRLVEEQKQQMIKAGHAIAPQMLGAIGKFRLQEDLLKPPKGDKNAKARLGFTRTALEVGGLIGGPAELHLHAAAGQICPEAAEMIAKKVLELQRKQEAINEEGISVNERPLLCQDAEAEPVPQPKQQETPAAIQADTHLIDEKELLEQTRLTFQSRPMARYSNGRRIS